MIHDASGFCACFVLIEFVFRFKCQFCERLGFQYLGNSFQFDLTLCGFFFVGWLVRYAFVAMFYVFMPFVDFESVGLRHVCWCDMFVGEFMVCSMHCLNVIC